MIDDGLPQNPEDATVHPGRSGLSLYPGQTDGNGRRIDSGKRADFWRLRVQDVRSKNAPSGTSVTDFDILVVSRKIGLPDLVGKEAAIIHRKWRTIKAAQHGVSNASCVVACVIMATRMHRIPMDYKHAIDVAEADEEEVWAAIKRLKRESGIDEIQNLLPDPIPILGMAAAQLRVPERIRTLAIDFINAETDHGVRPSCTAGKAILRAYESIGETPPFSIEALAKTCWTTPSRLHKGFKPQTSSPVVIIP